MSDKAFRLSHLDSLISQLEDQVLLQTEVGVWKSALTEMWDSFIMKSKPYSLLTERLRFMSLPLSESLVEVSSLDLITPLVHSARGSTL